MGRSTLRSSRRIEAAIMGETATEDGQNEMATPLWFVGRNAKTEPPLVLRIQSGVAARPASAGAMAGRRTRSATALHKEGYSSAALAMANEGCVAARAGSDAAFG